MLKRQTFQEHLFFIDLDDTLVSTSLANSLAYRQAVLEVLGVELPIRKERITAKTIEQLIGKSSNNFNYIVNRKKELYSSFLEQTFINEKLLQFLIKVKATCPIYLVTQSEKERALETLKFHHLFSIFTACFYCKNINNKYQHTISKLKVNPQKIFIFEDDKIEITKALSLGIPQKNIFLITQ